ncbi:unnamed protein product [Vitrella brassicaformis CCMP3155]|uniref:Uncharacterized protein n=2 Tax=Vitrella brassicaformis TaxID=1169539 RepID=A0A0G4F3U0_VITBC|nr:unnamed protein product [Vitrella brassicaformis CCMP3155]|eukprot:CEM06505.1 unnamed protein product [Vitrella brassicaformis CCMP3155]
MAAASHVGATGPEEGEIEEGELVERSSANAKPAQAKAKPKGTAVAKRGTKQHVTPAAAAGARAAAAAPPAPPPEPAATPPINAEESEPGDAFLAMCESHKAVKRTQSGPPLVNGIDQQGPQPRPETLTAVALRLIGSQRKASMSGVPGSAALPPNGAASSAAPAAAAPGQQQQQQLNGCGDDVEASHFAELTNALKSVVAQKWAEVKGRSDREKKGEGKRIEDGFGHVAGQASPNGSNGGQGQAKASGAVAHVSSNPTKAKAPGFVTTGSRPKAKATGLSHRPKHAHPRPHTPAANGGHHRTLPTYEEIVDTEQYQEDHPGRHRGPPAEPGLMGWEGMEPWQGDMAAPAAGPAPPANVAPIYVEYAQQEAIAAAEHQQQQQYMQQQQQAFMPPWVPYPPQGMYAPYPPVWPPFPMQPESIQSLGQAPGLDPPSAAPSDNRGFWGEAQHQPPIPKAAHPHRDDQVPPHHDLTFYGSAFGQPSQPPQPPVGARAPSLPPMLPTAGVAASGDGAVGATGPVHKAVLTPRQASINAAAQVPGAARDAVRINLPPAPKAKAEAKAVIAQAKQAAAKAASNPPTPAAPPSKRPPPSRPAAPQQQRHEVIEIEDDSEEDAAPPRRRERRGSSSGPDRSMEPSGDRHGRGRGLSRRDVTRGKKRVPRSLSVSETSSLSPISPISSDHVRRSRPRLKDKRDRSRSRSRERLAGPSRRRRHPSRRHRSLSSVSLSSDGEWSEVTPSSRERSVSRERSFERGAKRHVSPRSKRRQSSAYRHESDRPRRRRANYRPPKQRRYKGKTVKDRERQKYRRMAFLAARGRGEGDADKDKGWMTDVREERGRRARGRDYREDNRDRHHISPEPLQRREPSPITDDQERPAAAAGAAVPHPPPSRPPAVGSRPAGTVAAADEPRRVVIKQEPDDGMPRRRPDVRIHLTVKPSQIKTETDDAAEFEAGLTKWKRQWMVSEQRRERLVARDKQLQKLGLKSGGHSPLLPPPGDKEKEPEDGGGGERAASAPPTKAMAPKAPKAPPAAPRIPPVPSFHDGRPPAAPLAPPSRPPAPKAADMPIRPPPPPPPRPPPRSVRPPVPPAAPVAPPREQEGQEHAEDVFDGNVSGDRLTEIVNAVGDLIELCSDLPGPDGRDREPWRAAVGEQDTRPEVSGLALSDQFQDIATNALSVNDKGQGKPLSSIRLARGRTGAVRPLPKEPPQAPPADATAAERMNQAERLNQLKSILRQNAQNRRFSPEPGAADRPAAETERAGDEGQPPAGGLEASRERGDGDAVMVDAPNMDDSAAAGTGAAAAPPPVADTVMRQEEPSEMPPAPVVDITGEAAAGGAAEPPKSPEPEMSLEQEKAAVQAQILELRAQPESQRDPQKISDLKARLDAIKKAQKDKGKPNKGFASPPLAATPPPPPPPPPKSTAPPPQAAAAAAASDQEPRPPPKAASKRPPPLLLAPPAVVPDQAQSPADRVETPSPLPAAVADAASDRPRQEKPAEEVPAAAAAAAAGGGGRDKDVEAADEETGREPKRELGEDGNPLPVSGSMFSDPYQLMRAAGVPEAIVSRVVDLTHEEEDNTGASRIGEAAEELSADMTDAALEETRAKMVQGMQHLNKLVDAFSKATMLVGATSVKKKVKGEAVKQEPPPSPLPQLEDVPRPSESAPAAAAAAAAPPPHPPPPPEDELSEPSDAAIPMPDAPRPAPLPLTAADEPMLQQQQQQYEPIHQEEQEVQQGDRQRQQLSDQYGTAVQPINLIPDEQLPVESDRAGLKRPRSPEKGGQAAAAAGGAKTRKMGRDGGEGEREGEGVEGGQPADDDGRVIAPRRTVEGGGAAAAAAGGGGGRSSHVADANRQAICRPLEAPQEVVVPQATFNLQELYRSRRRFKPPTIK